VDGRVWIGISEDVDFFSEKDPARRAARIQRPGRDRRDRCEKALPTHEDDLVVLQVIATMEQLGLNPVPTSLAEEFMEHFTATPHTTTAMRRHRFSLGISRLRDGGWLKEDERTSAVQDRTMVKTLRDVAELGTIPHEMITWLLNKPPEEFGNHDLCNLLGVGALRFLRDPELRHQLLVRVRSYTEGRFPPYAAFARTLVEEGDPGIQPLAANAVLGDGELEMLAQRARFEMEELPLAQECLEKFTGDPKDIEDLWLILGDRALRFGGMLEGPRALTGC
jgi:hypothetical protein